jgi:hypothetical protein
VTEPKRARLFSITSSSQKKDGVTPGKGLAVQTEIARFK